MKRKSKLKLYVWIGFSPDYTDGLAVAIADSEAKAQEQIVAQHGYSPSEWGTLTVYSLSKPMAETVSGGS